MEKRYFLERTWVVTLGGLVYQTPKDSGLRLLILCAPGDRLSSRGDAGRPPVLVGGFQAISLVNQEPFSRQLCAQQVRYDGPPCVPAEAVTKPDLPLEAESCSFPSPDPSLNAPTPVVS